MYSINTLYIYEYITYETLRIELETDIKTIFRISTQHENKHHNQSVGP